MTELVDTIDKDLGDVEREVFDLDDECSCDDNEYDDEFDEDDFDDEDLYECVCPSCGDSICIGENFLAEGGITCPNCGEVLEFDYSEEEEAPEDAETPTEE